jgi:hypothetical protein
MLIKWGNRKIGQDTLIFNMSSATDCPSLKLGLCNISTNNIAKCYALKAEKLYGQKIIDYRRSQAAEWKSKTGDTLLADFIRKIRGRKTETRFLRYNEAGDFNDQSDIEKLSYISRGLREIEVITYGYTARSDLDFTGKNFLCKGSGFINPVLNGSTIVIQKDQPVPEDYIECPGTKNSCANCNLCKCNFNFNIAFRKH